MFQTAITRCALTGAASHQDQDLISHSVTLSWHEANQSLPYPNIAGHRARKWQVSILNSSVWLDPGSNPRSLDFPIPQNGRQTLYSFCHPSSLNRDISDYLDLVFSNFKKGSLNSKSKSSSKAKCRKLSHSNIKIVQSETCSDNLSNSIQLWN